ncbi:aldo/keto reductase [Paenibacillus mucilaginosus]|uniref:Aldo/keto reductase n=3 Tax=Paenibacillus mucilaginosus TaxID=61624 RepID=H6NFJ7_9BACL|nr:aldo/keto reductase [Paenibacillus mucilaginosus]AEI41550.1 aldo/keto reductase [Paenibacillus mucilaginosus KNP414]AFC30083.1 aldo/keto reductase [Paenibacillus mucilaginosus 3016]AFH62345.1 aldo/keto reductase [Paenibacillus mucilaginosus K02]MCG7215415.1 aldo/keto reductase [Paenibacillus mucilaginosus]WDM30553.1 aldo/keto reductase [Paenibacillus mucilaginosus]
MRTITIQGLDKPVSCLIKGSDYFREDVYEKAARNLDAYFAIGGNTIDTAYIYCGGESEKTIGRWMAERGNRDQVIILTKGAHHNKDGPRVNPEAIEADLQESLQRLGTDYVDLYALHRDDPSVPVGIIMDALNEHIQAGRIRAIGGSNWTTARLQEANEYAAQHGLVPFTFSSPNLSLAKANEPFWSGCVSADSSDCAWHEQHQLPLLSWSSQARGFFTGRFTPEVRDNADLVRVFYSDANWDRLRRAEQLAAERGVTAIQIALAYVLNQPFPACALIGAQTPEELESCRQGAEIVLTREELEWLEHGTPVRA